MEKTYECTLTGKISEEFRKELERFSSGRKLLELKQKALKAISPRMWMHATFLAGIVCLIAILRQAEVTDLAFVVSVIFLVAVYILALNSRKRQVKRSAWYQRLRRQFKSEYDQFLTDLRNATRYE